MSTFETPEAKKTYRLTSVEWDCPNNECKGWLELFGHENGTGCKPTIKWIRCSNQCGIQCIISAFQQKKTMRGMLKANQNGTLDEIKILTFFLKFCF
jgi:hypothetical protein